MRKIQFTKQGYDDLMKEKADLDVRRAGAVEELAYARNMGDLSENAAYKVARSKLSGIDRRLRQINNVLRKATVIEAPKDGYADIGAQVVFTDGAEEKKVVLVDGWESDFTKGKISIHSPIGKALRGKRAGDPVAVTTPSGEKKYKIVSVS